MLRLPRHLRPLNSRLRGNDGFIVTALDITEAAARANSTWNRRCGIVHPCEAGYRRGIKFQGLIRPRQRVRSFLTTCAGFCEFRRVPSIGVVVRGVDRSANCMSALSCPHCGAAQPADLAFCTACGRACPRRRRRAARRADRRGARKRFGPTESWRGTTSAISIAPAGCWRSSPRSAAACPRASSS